MLAERSCSRCSRRGRFPYTVRLVCEILGPTARRHGSSAATLALMDAGVPIKPAVAGISVGPDRREARSKSLLTDIIGEEDTSATWTSRSPARTKGITAIQLDIKI